MSGSKRHSQSTPDFQKKKNKVGKGKRPAENATAATFTTGRIVISSRLQLPDKNEIVSKRKLPVKVLFSQLKHHNANKRCEALKDLREVFSEDDVLTDEVLPALLENSFNLYTEESESVRHNFYLFLKSVLPRLATTSVLAYGQRLLACLECGLTHLMSSVRMHALRTTSLYFTHHPALFSNNLLPFTMLHIQILSKIVHLGENVSGTRQKLSSDSRSFLWTTLIDHIVRFLEAILSLLSQNLTATRVQQSSMDPPMLHLTEGRIQVLSDNPKIQLIAQQFCCSQNGEYHLLPYGFTKALPLLSASLQSEETCMQSVDYPSSGATRGKTPTREEIEKLVITLMPLFLECWIDTAPGTVHLGKTPNTQCLESLLKVARGILVLQRLVRKFDALMGLSMSRGEETTSVQLRWDLWKKSGGDFIKQLMLYFPFSRSLPTVLAKEVHFKSEVVSMVMSLDLYACELLMSQLPLAIGEGRTQDVHILRLNDFIKNNISNIPVNFSGVSFSSLLSISVSTLLEMLELVSGPLKSNASLVHTFSSNLLQFYSKLHTHSSARATFDQHFTEMMKTDVITGQMNPRDPIQTQLLIPWLVSLPEQFVELTTGAPLTDEVKEVCGGLLRTMTSLAPVGIKQFGESLQRHILKMMSNLHGVQLPRQFQSAFIELILYSPFLDAAELLEVAVLVHSGALDLSSVSYLLGLVDQRLIKSSIPLSDDLSPEEEVGQRLLYLRFMLTLAIGYTEAELEEVQGDYKPKSDVNRTTLLSVGSVVVVPLVKTAVFRDDFREEITACVCECLWKTAFSSQLWDLTEEFFADIWANEEQVFLPISAVSSVLQLSLSFIQESSSIPESLCQGFADFLTTVLLSSTVEPFTAVEPFTTVEPANTAVQSTAIAQPNTTSPSLVDPLSSSKEMKKCLQLVTEILSVSEQSLANVLQKFHSLLHDVKYGRMDTAYGVSGVHSLMILLEEPRMELSLRKCRPLVVSVGHTALTLIQEFPLKNEDLARKLDFYCLH